MPSSLPTILEQLLVRLQQVQRDLGHPAADPPSGATRLADALDSMGMAEFLLLVATDCGATPAALEEAAGRRFGTVAELAEVLRSAGWELHEPEGRADAARALPLAQTYAEGGAGGDRPARAAGGPVLSLPLVGEEEEEEPLHTAWLAATAVRLPETVQTGVALDALLGRPAGWLASHAGIRERRVWDAEDPLAAAADAARDCLRQAHLETEEVGALLVTSEAPPLLAGLAAALHQRLELQSGTAALEVGGACTAFLNALWLAETLVERVGVVLLVAVEAHSHHLRVEPGPAGEVAALFGDGAAACVLCEHPLGEKAVPLVEVALGVEEDSAALLRADRSATGTVEVHMEGRLLANRAVRAMTRAVRDLAGAHGLSLEELSAVVVHGGNGRLSGLLARQLGLPAERVTSETSRTGNLGSASLPVAWAARRHDAAGPVVWTAAGAGLTWGAALTGQPEGTW